MKIYTEADVINARAEARAEALREAASILQARKDRADETDEWWEGYIDGVDDSIRDIQSRAILADEPKEEREAEVGWMIEKPGPIVMWWNGCPKREGNGAWSSDPNDGIRFCRRIDAELCAIAQGFSLSKVLITEHRWG